MAIDGMIMGLLCLMTMVEQETINSPSRELRVRSASSGQGDSLSSKIRGEDREI